MELCCENSQRFKAVDCFRRKTPSQMFDRVLDMPLHNNLLQLTEGLRRSFPPLGLGKGILDSRSLVIPLINTKNKKMESWTHPTSSFPWATIGTKRQNIWSSFIYSFFCARPFDQKLGSSLIYFVHFYTTIRAKYMVLFHLFFLLCTIIRPKVKLLIDLFLSLHTTIRPKYMVLFHLFFLLYTTIDQKIGSSLTYFFYLHTTIPQKYVLLTFILSLCTTIRPKTRVLVNLLILFSHDHSTKLYGPLSVILSFDQKLGSSWFISFISTRQFDRNLWSSFIYSFFCTQPFNQK